MIKLQDSVQIPIKIEPCPIKEVVAEIRYKNDISPEHFAIIICAALNKNNSNSAHYGFDRQPITDMPLAVRQTNPNLKYQAHYIINIDDVVIRISLSSISIAIQGTYKGWNRYYGFVTKFIAVLKRLNIPNSIWRIGLRYSSFFKEDILQNIQINVSISGNNVTDAKNYIRTEWLDNNINYVLQVSNQVTLTENRIASEGSLIDIDLYTLFNDGNNTNLDHCETLLVNFHENEKKLFFQMLKPEFLKSLNPEYEV